VQGGVGGRNLETLGNFVERANLFSSSFSSSIHLRVPTNGLQCNNFKYEYIKPNSFIPNNFNFHKIDKEEDLFLGVELEIDKGGMTDKNAKQVIDFLGEQNVYCKHDGSLESGFEIVTHPCTYEYHKNLAYEHLFKILSDLNYRSHDVETCGLHIHFNRNYFGKDKLTQDLAISKLLYIVEKFWDKVVIIARRNSNRFAKRYYLNDDETILDMYAKSKNSDKYGVVNLKHKDTVEIRIFKGTLNYNTFISTLEFVNKIVKFIKNIDIYNIQYITWNDIINEFSIELNTYINEREKIEEEKRNKQKEVVNSTYRNSYDFYNNSSGANISWDSDDGWVTYTPSQNIQQIYTEVLLEEMNIEQIKGKIKSIKKELKRANVMQKQMLNRELAKYTNKLGQLRRNNT